MDSLTVEAGTIDETGSSSRTQTGNPSARVPFSYHTLSFALTWENIVVNADRFTIDQDAVSSLEATIHQLLCHTASSAQAWETQSLNDSCGRDTPSVSLPCFYIGSDVGDANDCAVSSCKDAPLGHVNARSMLLSSLNPLNLCTRVQRWRTHRRHKGYTIVEKPFAVPGSCAPRSTATLADDSGEHDSGEAMPNEFVLSDDSEDSGDEVLTCKCDACRGPLYVLPLRELTECSLCDELYTDLAWCEWCRTFICPDCLSIMARVDSTDDNELSD